MFIKLTYENDALAEMSEAQMQMRLTQGPRVLARTLPPVRASPLAKDRRDRGRDSLWFLELDIRLCYKLFSFLNNCYLLAS